MEIRYNKKIKERKFMCKECGQTFCPSNCPNFSGGSRVGNCAACGEEIMGDDSRYSILGRLYCAYCVENARAFELADFFELSEVNELIEELGGEYRQD